MYQSIFIRVTPPSINQSDIVKETLSNYSIKAVHPSAVGKQWRRLKGFPVLDPYLDGACVPLRLSKSTFIYTLLAAQRSTIK